MPGNSSQAVPVVPGVSQSMVNDLLVLDYGEPQSLEITRARARVGGDPGRTSAKPDARFAIPQVLAPTARDYEPVIVVNTFGRFYGFLVTAKPCLSRQDLQD